MIEELLSVHLNVNFVFDFMMVENSIDFCFTSVLDWFSNEMSCLLMLFVFM